MDFTQLLANKNILVVGAHPDDEFEFMPMLAEACLFNGARCHFVVTSDAHSWGCLLNDDKTPPDECTRLRHVEMTNAAALVKGDVTFFGWEDMFYSHDQAGLQRNLAKWAVDNGGHEALVARMRTEVAKVRPDVILTMDPRHGESCHPNHRATALLLIEALKDIPDLKTDIWMEDDFWVPLKMHGRMLKDFNKGAIYPWPDRQPKHLYDATRRLPDGKEAWSYLVEDERAHRSQFTDLPDPALPGKLRQVVLGNLKDIDPYADLCTPLHLKLQSFDLHGEPQLRPPG